MGLEIVLMFPKLQEICFLEEWMVIQEAEKQHPTHFLI